HLGQTVGHAARELRAGLHAHLDGLERAQGHVSDDLGGRGGGSPDEVLVLGLVGLAEVAAEQVLEVLVETELARALHSVAGKSRAPALHQAGHARAEAEVSGLAGEDHADAGDGTREHLTSTRSGGKQRGEKKAQKRGKVSMATYA